MMNGISGSGWMMIMIFDKGYTSYKESLEMEIETKRILSLDEDLSDEEIIFLYEDKASLLEVLSIVNKSVVPIFVSEINLKVQKINDRLNKEIRSYEVIKEYKERNML